MNRSREILTKSKVLIVEDDRGLGEMLQEEIVDAGLQARRVDTAEEALSVAASWLPDLIVSDLRLPGADGLALMRRIQTDMPENMPDVLIITAFGSVAKAVESLKAGAEDFLTKPINLEHFMLTTHRILEKRMLRKEIKQMKGLLDGGDTFHGMVGRSRPMLTLFQQIRQIAKADGPVLIIGESGTGKELVARAIHRESKGRDKPFLAVNCAGIPEHLLESEFFGHKAGAFTGAGKPRQGLFAEAENGTLLLDEISEMPLALQAKFLRVLQDGKVRPVGSNHEQQVNVRILASTHCDLEQRVKAHQFREDLFYRLETFPLRVPPLRERDEDIDLLVAAFLTKQAFAAGKNIRGLSERAQEMLHQYPFPGNVRELQNVIERAVVFCQNKEIRPEHLPARIQKHTVQNNQGIDRQLMNAIQTTYDDLPSLEQVEQHYIRYVVDKLKGNKRRAATVLGIARRTLYRRLDETENAETDREPQHDSN